MDISSIAPYFILSALYVVIGYCIAKCSDFYRQSTSASRGSRFAAVDGLRGFLALGVFFSHCLQHYWYVRSGQWGDAASGFYSMTGQIGVALFFQITAFLFWTKVLKVDGRLNTASLYESRIRRLAPMYLVSVLLVFLIVALESDFALRTSLKDLIKDAHGWLAFGFMETGEINEVKDAHTINAVYWTLAYEWAFYISLPILGLFVSRRRFAVLAAIVMLFGVRTPIVLNFLCGAVAAIVVDRYSLHTLLGRRWLAVVPIAALVTIFTLFDGAYGIAQSVLLLLFFLFVVHGNDLFGLLASRGAKMLGDVSYSIYLLHGIVLYAVLRVVGRIAPISEMTGIAYWGLVGCCGCIVVLLSAITYRWVEHPYLLHLTPGATDRIAPSAAIHDAS